MFRFNRGFRAVTFVFPKKSFPRITSLNGVLKLIPKERIGDVEIIETSLPKSELAHTFFYSSTYHPTSEDDELKTSITVKRNGSTFFKYNIYIIVEESKTVTYCTIAVPFSSLGPEVFATIHKACGESRPYYHRLNLARALGVLHSGISKQSRISVRSLEVPLTTDENVDRLWLAG